MFPLTHKPFYELGDTDDIVFMRPFAPAVAHSCLPEKLVSDFNEEIDRNTNRQDWSDHLVGKLNSETLIPTQVLKPWASNFSEVAIRYVQDYASRHCYPVSAVKKPAVHITSAWFNRQIANNFNPLYIHSPAELSCVGFLKLPDNMEKEWLDDDKDHHPCRGHLEFVCGTMSSFGRHTFSIRPRVGDFLLFPADLYQTVYPFESDGERRSFSMNFTISEREVSDEE